MFFTKLQSRKRNTSKPTRLEHFSVTDEPLNLMGSAAQLAYEQIFHELKGRPGTQTEAKLKSGVLQWPDTPQFLQLLSTYYQLTGKKSAHQKTVDRLVAAFPDYLFARIEMAQFARLAKKPDEFYRWLGPGLELHELYPDRTLFHESEVAAFYGQAANFLLGEGRDKEAEQKYAILKKGATDHEITRDFGLRMLRFRMERMTERVNADKPRQRDAIVFQTAVILETDQPPMFFHPEIGQLYQFEANALPEKVQRKLMALPRVSLVADLERVLRDSMSRWRWFESNFEDLESEAIDFPIHAFRFLAALGARQCLPTVFDFFRMEEKFGELWLGEMSDEYCKEPFYLLAQHDLPALRDFLFEKNVHRMGKHFAIKTVEQVALQQPARREECLAWLREAFDFFLKNIHDSNVFDSWVASDLIDAARSLRAVEFLPQAGQFFEADVIGHSWAGDFEEVKKDFLEPWGKWEIDPMPTSIGEFYSGKHRDRRVSNPAVSKIVEDLGADDFDLRLIGEMLGHAENEWMDDDDEDDDFYPPAAKPAPLFKAVGRNEPCPCGSGKKFKKCHGG